MNISLFRLVKSIVSFISCSSTAEIVEQIRCSISSENSVEASAEEPIIEEPVSEEPIREEPVSQGVSEEPISEQHETNPKISSSYAGASMIVKDNGISFDPKMHVFNVKGTSEVVRVVTIFPRESCSCPSTSGCYHILAVKLSLGIQFIEKKSTRNLTKLRKNTWSRSDKRSGRKNPRTKDIEQKGTILLLYNYDSVSSACVSVHVSMHGKDKLALIISYIIINSVNFWFLTSRL